MIDSYSLRELEARLLIREDDRMRGTTEDLAEAQGIMFICPKCFHEDGAVGAHSVLCWFKNRGVPDDEVPGPGRWNPSGTSLDDLTFVPPGAVSVLLTSGCGWHGFVRNGRATLG